MDSALPWGLVGDSVLKVQALFNYSRTNRAWLSRRAGASAWRKWASASVAVAVVLDRMEAKASSAVAKSGIAVSKFLQILKKDHR